MVRSTGWSAAGQARDKIEVGVAVGRMRTMSLNLDRLMCRSRKREEASSRERFLKAFLCRSM